MRTRSASPVVPSVVPSIAPSPSSRVSRRAAAPVALLVGLLALPVAGSTDHYAAVQSVVDTLFNGMRTRDEATLRAVFAPEARLGTDGIDGFIAAVTTGERHLDEITFNETILVDGDLAMAWTPYNLFVDGEFHHCGVDLFVMHLREDGWLITQLDDTRRTEGCDPTRRD